MEQFIEFTDEFGVDVSFENQQTELAVVISDYIAYLTPDQFSQFKKWILEQEIN